MGTEAETTVYAAELSGIGMALEQIGPNQRGNVNIFVDSQAAIQAVRNPTRPSGQYLLSKIYHAARGLREGQFVTMRWIPAHIGVPGNEAADKAAKEAAVRGLEAAAGAGQPIIRLAAAAKREAKQRTKDRWAKQWERDRTGKPTKRLVRHPDRRILRLYDGLSKPYSSILIQMRSMRIGLKHFLFKIQASDSDRCRCDEGSQTPRHVLMQCPLYTDLRKKMLDKIATRTDIRRVSLTDYNGIVSHPQAIRYVAEFMHETGLLGQFQYVDFEPEPDPETIGLAAMVYVYSPAEEDPRRTERPEGQRSENIQQRTPINRERRENELPTPPMARRRREGGGILVGTLFWQFLWLLYGTTPFSYVSPSLHMGFTRR
jgi:hypothetical protein